MKKHSRWTGIIGGFLVLISLAGEAYSLSHPTGSVRGIIASSVTYLLMVGLGVFLVIIYLKNKQAEDAGHIPPTFAPNSPEDIESLKKKRNRIFGFVLLIEFIGSIGSWIMNDYGAGLTPINVLTIFDVLMNIVFIYLIVALFKNRNILNSLLYVMIFYGIGGAAIELWKGDWLGAASEVLFSVYFVYAIKAPVDRKNHRIAHVVILPAVVILIVAFTSFDAGKIDQLSKNEAKLEQEFVNANTDLTSAYSAFLQKEIPSATDIADVRTAIKHREGKIKNVILAVNTLQAEYNKQLVSEPQKKALEKLQNILAVLDLHRKQADTIEKLLIYIERVDLKDLSDKQRVDIGALIKEVNSFESQIRGASLKLTQP